MDLNKYIESKRVGLKHALEDCRYKYENHNGVHTKEYMWEFYYPKAMEVWLDTYTQELVEKLREERLTKEMGNQFVQKNFKAGERSILDQKTVGWDVDVHQLDGTTCKWRLIERFNTDPDDKTPITNPN